MKNHILAARLLAVLALATLIAPAATAQILNPQVGSFGTQVRAGDADYYPLDKADPVMPQIAEFDFGITGDVNDNCILLLNNARITTAATVVPINKDLRMTPCQGKDAGTQIGDVDTVERSIAYKSLTDPVSAGVAGQPTTSFQYGDVNNNGKYDKGDNVYLTTKLTAGLASTTGTGAWTVRMTPVGGFAAGTFVHNSDADFSSYRTGAKVQAFSLVEREDKGWYLIPVKANVLVCGTVTAASLTGGAFPAGVTSLKVCDSASAPQYKNGFIPANSLRIGLAGTFTLQPDVIALEASLANPDGAEAGKTLPVVVTIVNNGGDAGQGVLVTRINKEIVDVRITPKLSPGEKVKIVINVPGALVPGGSLELEVNDVFSAINVKGAAAVSEPSAVATTSTTTVQQLQQQVAALQARLDAQPAAQSSAPNLKAAASQGSPSLSLVGLVVVLGIALLVMRRRD